MRTLICYLGSGWRRDFGLVDSACGGALDLRTLVATPVATGPSDYVEGKRRKAASLPRAALRAERKRSFVRWSGSSKAHETPCRSVVSARDGERERDVRTRSVPYQDFRNRLPERQLNARRETIGSPAEESLGS
jgi:hypothetical protein